MARRQIKPLTLGERLTEVRCDRQLSLDQAARELKIPFKYLEALEENNPLGLPDRSQAKKFLQAYTAYLDIAFNECWELYLEIESAKKIKGVDDKYLWSWPKFLKGAGVATLILSVVLFLALKIWDIFSPPKLIIDKPEDGKISYQSEIAIMGSSAKEAEIIINNKNIFVDPQGRFSTTIDLQKGLNLIKITSKKRYSRTKEVELRVLYSEQNVINQ